MVGGGPGAFIGAVHRNAAALDGEMELIGGAFSSDPDKSRQQGDELHLDLRRVYGSYQEMAEKEAALPERPRARNNGLMSRRVVPVCSARAGKVGPRTAMTRPRPTKAAK